MRLKTDSKSFILTLRYWFELIPKSWKSKRAALYHQHDGRLGAANQDHLSRSRAGGRVALPASGVERLADRSNKLLLRCARALRDSSHIFRQRVICMPIFRLVERIIKNIWRIFMKMMQIMLDWCPFPKKEGCRGINRAEYDDIGNRGPVHIFLSIYRVL